LDLYSALSLQLAKLFDIEDDLFTIPVALGDCRMEFFGCLDGVGIPLVCTPGDEGESRFQIIDIKLKLALLVSWVEWCSDSGTKFSTG
jgi:hypothetical protein